MATISTYVSGHTEAADVREFLEKQLLNAGERPIAFFDGVFYESHQERVGNIAYQDYLIYSDKAVYLWARGADKDYLDRFALGAVSINSRNKDDDFATLNLRIRREGKEPVYVIFDMVEIDEAGKISSLHTIIESIIENNLGGNFRGEIPEDIAEEVFRGSGTICPPSALTFGSPGDADAAAHGSRIGYGQDLLEQYKASIGYAPEDFQGGNTGYGSPGRQQDAEGFRRPGIPKELEDILPTDPESLKRIAANLRDSIGEAQFKFRDQFIKDIQNVPNDVATVLTALSDLVTNIADNPQAEKFVLNAIQTAVKNDGILGSMGKILKLTTGFGPAGPKPPSPKSSGRPGAGKTSGKDFDGGPDNAEAGTIRRKKVTIHTDDETEGLSGASLDKAFEEMEAVFRESESGTPDTVEEKKVRSKKLSVIAEKPDTKDAVPGDTAASSTPSGDDTQGEAVRTRKIKVIPEESAEPHVDEVELKEALKEVADTALPVAEKPEEPVRKKLPVRSGSNENDKEGVSPSKVYRTLESASGNEEGGGEGSRPVKQAKYTGSSPRRGVKKSK